MFWIQETASKESESENSMRVRGLSNVERNWKRYNMFVVSIIVRITKRKKNRERFMYLRKAMCSTEVQTQYVAKNFYWVSVILPRFSKVERYCCKEGSLVAVGSGKFS